MENKKNMIAYCGLYCGECIFFKGEIADMARDIRKKLRAVKFERISAGLSVFSKEFKNYSQCYSVLGAMVKMRCRKPCVLGGGNPFCKIRACCNKKNITGCWQCKDFENCSKLEFLEPIHNKANIKNMRKIKKSGIDSFLKGTKYW